jgi:hypothetical protein
MPFRLKNRSPIPSPHRRPHRHDRHGYDIDSVVDAAKTLTGTSQAFTSGASMAIGEIASYSVSLAVNLAASLA